jgi:hypothetical protein
MAKVIGIMGLAGAGKDTVAAMLQRGLIGAGLTNVTLGKFAAKMYAIASHLFTDVSLNDRKLKETPHVFDVPRFLAALAVGIDMVLYRHLKPVQRQSMVDEMYRLLSEAKLFRDTGHWTGGEIHISPRQFLQNLGTAGTNTVPGLWVDTGMKDFSKRKGVVLVTDCRFEEECSKMDVLLFVKRSGVQPVRPHKSEALAIAINDGASFPGLEFIDNDGTLEDLEREVASFATSHAILFAHAAKESA